MEPLQLIRQTHDQFMTISLSSILRPKPLWFSLYSLPRAFCTSSPLAPTKRISASRNGVGVRVKVSHALQLKEDWLASLSCPFPQSSENLDGKADLTRTNSGSSWVIGIDPDVSGALALLKGNDSDSACSAQVDG